MAKFFDWLFNLLHRFHTWKVSHLPRGKENEVDFKRPGEWKKLAWVLFIGIGLTLIPAVIAALLFFLAIFDSYWSGWWVLMAVVLMLISITGPSSAAAEEVTKQ